MPFLFLVCLISISTFLSTRQEKAQIPSTNPELIEGPWETTNASGIDGIFLTTVTGSNWQTINIRVYHRDGGKETWGYFGTNERATAESYSLQDDHSFTLFDGSHLRIHFVDVTDLKPFDLDVTFSSSSHEWSGTWSRPRQTSNVVLRRPEPKSGLTPNPFVGDWMTVSSNYYVASGSLHIRQSSDGTFSAWLDRVIASSDRRNGEFLQVHSATASELDLERPGATGLSYRYRGSLSGDGQMLTGDWAENGGARLNAPDKFRKVPGKFYKGRSQEKTQLLRPEVFLLRSPLDRARSVLTYRAMCSVAGPCDPVVWVSLPPSSFSSTHKDAQFIAKAREWGPAAMSTSLQRKLNWCERFRRRLAAKSFFLSN